jgi:hypothetical protein
MNKESSCLVSIEESLMNKEPGGGEEVYLLSNLRTHNQFSSNKVDLR